MNIIQFVEDPELLNDQSLSVAQKMALKAVYGLELDDEELSLFTQTTGLDEYYSGREWTEATFILGRRSGKSDKIASKIALFEACARKHELTPGQKGVVMVVASEKKRQARIVFDYILSPLESSPVLSKLILRVTTEEIFLKNGVSIQVFPCDPGRVRGYSLICFIGDEVAAWMLEGRRIDVSVLDAARPGLDFDYSKLIKISTPGMQKGEIYQDFKNYYGKANDDVLVFKGSTQLFNPTYSQRKLERLKKRKPGVYKVEHEAEFKKDVSSMYAPEMIDLAVNENRTLELSYNASNDYFAFVDVAGGGGRDAYAIAIGHRTEDGKVIIDVVRSRAPKFNPDSVTEQYVKLCFQYSVFLVTGDKFSGDWASNSWSKHSNGQIVYQKSDRTKSELYLESEGLFNTQMIELPNKEQSISELKDLIRKSRSGSKDSVDSYSGASEDEANVIAGVAANLSTLDDTPLPEPSFGIAEPAEDKDEKMAREARVWLLDRKPKPKDSDEEWLEKIDKEIEEEEREKHGKKVQAHIGHFSGTLKDDQERMRIAPLGHGQRVTGRKSLAQIKSYPVRPIGHGWDTFFDIDKK